MQVNDVELLTLQDATQSPGDVWGKGDTRNRAIHMQRRRPANLVHAILDLPPAHARGWRENAHAMATPAQLTGETLNMLLDTTGVAPVVWRDKSNLHRFTRAIAPSSMAQRRAMDD
jgi:hypothetical protein